MMLIKSIGILEIAIRCVWTGDRSATPDEFIQGHRRFTPRHLSLGAAL